MFATPLSRDHVIVVVVVVKITHSNLEYCTTTQQRIMFVVWGGGRDGPDQVYGHAIKTSN